MFSRWCAIGLIWRLPHVRSGDDAKAKPFANHLSAGEWILSGLIGSVGLAPIALAYTQRSGGVDARFPAAAIAAVAAAAVTALIAAAYFRRRIGGYTGDCLGAVQQLTELAFLLGGLAAICPARRIG
jgi:adenosylcobinamide-GDP ribazoletransferase